MFKKNDDSVALSNHEHCISQLAMRKSIATNSRQQPRNKRHENHVHKNSVISGHCHCFIARTYFSTNMSFYALVVLSSCSFIVPSLRRINARASRG